MTPSYRAATEGSGPLALHIPFVLLFFAFTLVFLLASTFVRRR